jgi:hypothetical protein
LEILIPILLDKNLTFKEAKKVIERELKGAEYEFDFQNYEMVLE